MMKMKKKKGFFFNISLDLYNELKKESETMQISMSVIISMALRKWLFENRKISIN